MSGIEVRQQAQLGRSRVEAVMETLVQLRAEGETLAELAHDARNMVTALSLYCDLLEEPGVLAEPFRHYGGELRLVAGASRRLVEKMIALDSRAGQPARAGQGMDAQRPPAARPRRWEPMATAPIQSLAEELEANRNLLAALAGPAVSVRLETAGGGWPVRLSSEDLTRILVNLLKNAAEAMPRGGTVAIRLDEQPAGAGALPALALTVDDDGTGIPAGDLDKIFAAGYTTRAGQTGYSGPAGHRGLGLAITRSIVEAAGGRICAENLIPRGARLRIELPVRGG